LFLDLDGTIAEITERHHDVLPSSSRTRVLAAANRALSGRLAVLTGRSLEDADRILECSVVPLAAIHGLVRRMPDGQLTRIEVSPRIDEAKAALMALSREHQGLVVEDKGASVALHYRQAPEAEQIARAATARIAKSTGLGLQQGSMVSELRTVGPDKGDSVHAFLDHPTFAGAIPVVAGDDLTDEAAFAVAEQLGGYGVLVGQPRPTHASFHLPAVTDVLAWLDPGARP
jgi:trehalose 6-phosphate phosphatase